MSNLTVDGRTLTEAERIKLNADMETEDKTAEAAKPERKKPICRNCGSDNLERDALVSWNIDTQDWEVMSVLDNVTCRSCGYESNWSQWVLI